MGQDQILEPRRFRFVYLEVGMKTLPKHPFIQNLAAAYRAETKETMLLNPEYRNWLSQFGFAVPVYGDELQFPDDFPDDQLILFMLKWS